MPPSSWAKKTGFRPKFSGETNAAHSGQISVPQPKPREPQPVPDLEMGRVRPPPNGVAQGQKVPPPAKDQSVKKRRDSDGVPSTNGQATPAAAVVEEPSQPRRTARHEELVEGLTVDDEGFASRHLHMKYELRDSPGLGITVLEFQVKVVSLSPFFHIVEILMLVFIVIFMWVIVVPIGVYGMQHYVSMLGSLILIPLVIVPAMGGTHVSGFRFFFFVMVKLLW